MAKKLINLGAAPNDNTGDSLRAGGSIINSNFNELYDAKEDLESNIAGKTDKGGYPGTSQDLKNYIDTLSFDGAITYDTVNDLPTPVPSAGTTAKVGNDPDPNNNGNWYVSGGAWVQVAQNNTVDDIFGLPEKLSMAKVSTTSDKVCAYGIDSLTDGSGAPGERTYMSTFDPIWRGAFGSSEIGFVWLNSRDMNNSGFVWGNNLPNMISQTDFSIAPFKYSLCGKGCYQASGTGGYIDVNTVDKHFDSYRLYYLQQPGGGTFKVGFNEMNINDMIDVNSDGALSLQFVDVDRSPNNSLRSAVRQITGNCVFFGIKYMNAGSNASTLNIATGGMTLEKINGLDRNFRQQWYSLLKPAVLLLNAGTNDQDTATKSELKQWLGDYIDDVKAGHPGCNVVIVQPNQTSAWNVTNAPEHYAARQELANEKEVDFFDTIKIIGDYDYFVGNGMMIDGTHPNEKGCRILTEHYLRFLGIQNYGNYLGIPLSEDVDPTSNIKLSGDVPTYSATHLDLGVNYDALKLGMYSDFSVMYIEITAIFRLSGSKNITVKRLNFALTSENVYGNVVYVSDLVIEDIFSSTGTVPVPTITLSLVDNRALISFNSDVDLASVSMVGKWQLAKEVNTNREILFNDI